MPAPDHDDTAVDAPALSAASDPPTGRRLTAAESDPATAFVRRDDFIELPPGSIVGDIYEIDAKLGAGAMGEVYAARHVKLGKRVAIKVIGPRLSEDAAAIERFAMEAQTLAKIQHPAIVAVDHVGELADGRAYFVMELLRGESLFERLSRGRVPFSEALRILDQMARGLEAAHAHGVTHRDLKPENTFLVHLPGEAPIVKLLDFGLAKLATDVDRRTERTQSGVAIGTPLYMSPEQMRGPNVDHRTDVYALGAVAYELLLGRHPFEHARTAPELFAAHLHEAPPLPRSIWPEIPPQLDLVLFAMLAKDPSYRPTLAQVRSVLADVAAGAARHAPERAETMIVGLRSRRTKTVAIALGTLIGGIVIGAALTSRPNTETTHDAQGAVPIAPPAPIKHGGADVVAEAPAIPIITPSARSRSGSGAHPNGGSAAAPSRTGVPHSQKLGGSGSAASTASTATAPIDAGVDAAVVEPPDAAPPQRPSKPPPVDRNQTVNPFAPKHPR